MFERRGLQTCDQRSESGLAPCMRDFSSHIVLFIVSVTLKFCDCKMIHMLLLCPVGVTFKIRCIYFSPQHLHLITISFPVPCVLWYCDVYFNLSLISRLEYSIGP